MALLDSAIALAYLPFLRSAMPIYAYKCSACGHAKDVLQKISDDPLIQCPHCGAETFTKQITAAGFQLKGSGWYVSDFRGNSDGANSGVGKPAESGKTDAPAATATPATAAAATATAPVSTASKSAAPPAASTPASS
jgi:putative FmdB family regulatory protein